jgi:exonuclease III
MEELYNNLSRSKFESLILSGDFNICPDDSDVWSTQYWNSDTICCSIDERLAFSKLLSLDSMKNLPIITNSITSKFTWYGYKTSWRKYHKDVLIDCTGKYGIKCDHILSNNLQGNINLLSEYRFPAIKLNTTSDHVPMLVNFE